MLSTWLKMPLNQIFSTFYAITSTQNHQFFTFLLSHAHTRTYIKKNRQHLTTTAVWSSIKYMCHYVRKAKIQTLSKTTKQKSQEILSVSQIFKIFEKFFWDNNCLYRTIVSKLPSPPLGAYIMCKTKNRWL
jgi:hypothetical protein